jgi:hypothetical protein
MKSVRTIVVFSLVALVSAVWLLFAQAPTNKTQNNIKPNSANSNTQSQIASSTRTQLDSLTGRVRSAPPEVAADALLAIASASTIDDKERSIALISEAFEIGGRAYEHVKQRSWGLQVDTRAGFKEAASDLQLDRMSLQSRAVIMMIPLDKDRARQMFEQMSQPRVQIRACEDSLVDDLNPYYVALAAVADGCFKKKEKKSSLHIQFLADRISRIKSIPEVIPAEKAIVKTSVSRDELLFLVQALIKALNRVSDDPRSFAFTIQRDEFAATTAAIIAKLKDNNVAANDFVKVTRSFVVRALSGEVCGDAGWVKDGTVTIPRSLQTINTIFAQPISTDEIRPARIGAKADDVVYWTSPQAKKLMDVARRLRFGSGSTQLSDQQRESGEWRQQLLEFLDLIDQWDANSETSEDDYFHEKCSMYRLLVELCPDDLQRDAVLRQYAKYLKETSSRYKGHMEWVLHVKMYLRALASKPDATQKESLDPWLSSADASLQIYGELAMLKLPKN